MTGPNPDMVLMELYHSRDGDMETYPATYESDLGSERVWFLTSDNILVISHISNSNMDNSCIFDKLLANMLLEVNGHFGIW